MKILSLLDQLGTADAPAAAAPRRHLLRRLGTAGARAAAAALPFAVASPALAAPTVTSLDAILVLLRLEDLMEAFYTRALASAVLTNPAQTGVQPDFVRMLRHQREHAEFLRVTIVAAGLPRPTAPPAASYDFSGRRNNTANPELFPNVLTDYNAFLQLAQQLEDASASVYLGQLKFFGNDRQLLDAVVRMQLVEARHASHIRTLRRTAPAAVAVKSWPSTADPVPSPAILVPGASSGSPAPVSLYSLEANETQAVLDSTTIPFPTILTNTTAVQFRALAEAFDESLTTAQATALLNIFG